MNIIGIIAEYNPFHNGHLYHINKIKELYPDSLLVLVTSGYFTQRGHISVLSKESKTKIALDNNIELEAVLMTDNFFNKYIKKNTFSGVFLLFKWQMLLF